MCTSHQVVFWGSLVGICLTLVFGMALRAHHQKLSTMSNALCHGLERVYERLQQDQTKAGRSSGLISSHLIRAVLSKRLQPLELLPSFVSDSDIFIAEQDVPVPSNELICAVKLGDVYYALDASGSCKKLQGQDFNNWPHVRM